jgi:large subunit ribosomal protein L32
MAPRGAVRAGWVLCRFATRGRNTFLGFDLGIVGPMALPKRRHSHSRSRKRRSHNAVKPIQLVYCPQCQTPAPSHMVCPNCGYYQGRTLVATTE